MRTVIAVFIAAVPSLIVAAEPLVHLKLSVDAIDVTIGNEPFATYHLKGYKKPFFADLRAPGGIILTRSLDKEAVTDHPHHKGLWISVDEVDEHKHWKEDQSIVTRGKITIDKPADGSAEQPASFTVVNDWLDDDGKPIVTETTRFTISPDRLIAADIHLTAAGDHAVEFADTKEGFFAIRVRDELREKGGNGKITNANGKNGEAEAWGQTAPWVDYSGTVDGQPIGVAIFDHPDNLQPSRYHVRAYGLFAVSPFGESAYTNGASEAQPVELKPGETLRLRYAAYLHGGHADVAGRYKQYVKDTQSKE